MDTPATPPDPREAKRLAREAVRAENRRRFQEEQAQREAERRAAAEAKRKGGNRSLPSATDPTMRASVGGEPGDPFAPDALKALFGFGYRRLWNVFADPASTNQDIISAFTAARLAAGIGKEAPQPTEFKLPMGSLLRASDGASGVAPGVNTVSETSSADHVAPLCPPSDTTPPGEGKIATDSDVSGKVDPGPT